MPQRNLSFLSSILWRGLKFYKHHSVKPYVASVTNLHSLALKIGALADITTSTSFITLYAKAGVLDSSWAIFDGLSVRDVVSWNAMMTACVQSKCFQSAVTLFGTMLRDAQEIDPTTLLIVISALSNLNKLQLGKVSHGISLKKGLTTDLFLNNALVDMYAKCGDLILAESIFERMETRDVTSWNSMMCGCLSNGDPKKSLLYFTRMGSLGTRPDTVTLSCIISACSFMGELTYGESVHGLGVKLGYEEHSDTSVSNALISFYSKCDRIDAAELVFQGSTHRDVVSWNSMIAGFAEQGVVTKTFDLMQKMQLRGMVQPNAVTMLTLLPLCGKHGLWLAGRTIHGFTARRELGFYLPVNNSLLDMYMKCGELRHGNLLFTAMSDRDLISWNTMIRGYADNGRSTEAMVLFRELLRGGPKCSSSSSGVAILSSCNCNGEVHFGKTVHAWMVKCGFLEDILAVNSLICMYVNAGEMTASLSLLEANKVLADVVSWNTIIVACTRNGHYLAALEVFNQMRHDTEISPDSITVGSVVAAAGNLEFKSYGKLTHALSQKSQDEQDTQLRNALITMYCRCGDTHSAELLFYSSTNENLCSWNCMISGYAINRDGEQALELFHHLQFKPNEITIVSILSACAQTGALMHGREIHAYVMRCGHQENTFISSALLDMYSKCGRLENAIQIFRSSGDKSVVSWNSMISAYGFHGYGEKAIELFDEMCQLGLEVTSSTFIALLSAFSHSGLVEEGWKYYNSMMDEFGIEPTVKHHVCMVDMLGRAGRLQEAYDFIIRIPDQLQSGPWGALLRACKDQGYLEMAKSVGDFLSCLEPENAGYYISLANAHAVEERWTDVAQIWKKVRGRGLNKPPAWSFIDVR